jgi:PAS domain S-box-containing protein
MQAKEKAANEALRNERVFLRTLIDNLPNAIYVKDKECRAEVVNVAAVRNGGKNSEAEILGKTDFDFFPKEIAAKFFADDMAVINNGKPVINKEEFFLDMDGRKRWQLTSKLPLRDGNGNVVGLIGIGTDITEQKRMEELLREGEERFRTIFENASIGIYRTTPDGRVLLANPAMVRLLGFKSFEELAKYNIEEEGHYLAEYPREKFRELIDEKGYISGLELMRKRKDGSLFWVRENSQVIYDENHNVAYYEGTLEDISERKQAEEALEKERALLRILIEHLPSSIFIKDKEYRKTIINRMHLRNIVGKLNRPEFGVESAILGKTDFDIYPKKLAEEYFLDDQKVIRDGQAIIDREEPSIMSDGQKRWVTISKIPLRDKAGEIIGMLGVSTDISERKLVEEAKEQENILLRTLIDNLPSAVFIKDNKYRKTVVNSEHLKSVAAHLGRLGLDPQTDIVGKTDFDLYPKDLAEEYFAEDQRVICDGVAVINEEQEGVNPDGKESWNLVSKIPLRDKDGTITGLVGITTDITTLKKNEDVIEHERILLRTLIDNLPAAVYVKDRNYAKVIANPVDVSQCGCSCEEELIGKTDFDLFPKEFAERFFQDDQKVIRDGESVFKREEQIIFPDGKEHWLLTSKIPLKDKKGAVIGLVGVGMDITEQRELNRALRQSEAELRALFGSMKDVVLVLNKDGRHLKVMSNDSLLYKPASEIIGKTSHEIFPKEQADFFLFVIRKTLESGEPQNVEYAIKIGDEERWRFATTTKLTEDSVLWVARDITELKLKQKEIAESESKYRELVENSLVGVYKVNLSGHMTYANKSMAEMLEYGSPQELMSVNSLDLYVSRDEREDLINELRKNGKTEKNKEIKFVTNSGKVKNVLISASLDETVISAMVKDITDIRVLEQQFIQTQKLEGLGNIAAGIAHDFNNLLGVIIGYSDLLTQSKYEQQKFDRGIRAINKAADRGRSLVKQLLTFARKTATTFDSLIVNDVVIEIERLLTETFPKTIEIHTELQKKLPPILADSTQIHQVLLNLCVNARDAMPGGGKLSIWTRTVEGKTLSSQHPDALSAEYIEIQVSDNGIGMDEETRRHIFEPFFTTKGVGKGTGLGLSVVYGIAESHRGFIDVISELGKGTTFSVFLPVQQLAVEQVELKSKVSEGMSDGAETVLIIEDEEMLRELLRTILESKGYKVISASDGEEGVQMFFENRNKVALVVSDLGLPKLSGEDVVSSIKQIDPNAKLIIATGFIDPEMKSDLAKIGVLSFILKPYKTDEVIHVVHDAIAGMR